MDFQIPKPMSHIGCQDLLEMDIVVYSGWLKYKVTLVNERFANLPFLGNVIRNTVHKVRSPWIQKYVVIHKGCVYIFNSDRSTKPRTAFSLYQYNMVLRAQQEFGGKSKDCLWAFKLVHVNSSSQFFSASSQKETKTWMSHLSKAMRKANDRPSCLRSPSSASGSSEESSYSDIEEAIYGPRDISSIKGSTLIEINNDDEEEEDYVSYGDVADLDPEREQEPEELDTQNLPPTRKNWPLPLPPDELDKDMPTGPAPIPPVARKGPDRPLPPLPNPIKNLLPPAPEEQKFKWQVPTPDTKPSTPRSKPHWGGVAVMMPPSTEKPKTKPKPKTFLPRENNVTISNVPEEDDVAMATWDGPKDEVKIMLCQISRAGAFIIRESSKSNNEQVLAVFVDGQVRQYKLHVNSYGQYYLDQTCKFNTVQDLLTHYRQNALPNTNDFLSQPYKYYSS